MFEESFPVKTVIIPEDSAPWYNEYLAKLRKKKSREFQKHRKSQKYKALKVLYNKQLKHAKKNYYTQKVERLKSSNPKQWYRQLKKLADYDKGGDIIEVVSIRNLSDKEQAESIADKFSSVANEYEVIDRSAINIPPFTVEDIPQFSVCITALLCVNRSLATLPQGRDNHTCTQSITT